MVVPEVGDKVVHLEHDATAVRVVLCHLRAEPVEHLQHVIHLRQRVNGLKHAVEGARVLAKALVREVQEAQDVVVPPAQRRQHLLLLAQGGVLANDVVELVQHLARAVAQHGRDHLFWRERESGLGARSSGVRSQTSQ